MCLRGVSEAELANLVHVPLRDFQQWLYGQDDESDEVVPFETQLEALKILGIQGDAPRPDIVHYWRIHEPLFSRAASTYWPLVMVLKSFGKAEAVFISRESDPFITFEARAHFGLKFQNFMAILEVTAHPLRNISFDPTSLVDVSWVPDTLGVLLPEADYMRLEPGAMKVRGLDQYLTYTSEMSQWEKLREAALENGIKAEAVAALMLGHDITKRLPSESPTAKPPVNVEVPVAPEVPKKTKSEVPAITELHVKSAANGPEDIQLFSVPVKGVNTEKV